MGKGKRSRLFLIFFVVFLAFFVIVWTISFRLDFSQETREIEYGLTFSHKYAWEDLGLDWTKVYWAILTDLNVKKIRLAAHWDMLEERDDEYNFNDLDWMIGKAAEQEVEVVLALGRRTPRWPECHDPSWIKKMEKTEKDEELLEMLKKAVIHFQKFDNIKMWQVENEPFLKTFGLCPAPDGDLLRREIELVKQLDDRPIMITDTGELSDWSRAASLSPVLGVTMYKTVWAPVLGAWRYPWPPVYYYYKAQRVKKKNKDLTKVLVAELQAEPWGAGQKIAEMTIAEQMNFFNLNDFERSLDYARRAGFEEAYLWGAEWWYWLKEVKHIPDFWQRARRIWQKDQLMIQ